MLSVLIRGALGNPTAAAFLIARGNRVHSALDRVQDDVRRLSRTVVDGIRRNDEVRFASVLPAGVQIACDDTWGPLAEVDQFIIRR
ncbi:MAG: hypothetical protein AAGA95_08035, partial [Pseudomonadota bacterium]